MYCIQYSFFQGYFDEQLSKTSKRQKICKIQRWITYYIIYWILHLINPLRLTAIQKLLEIIDRVRLYPSCSVATALDSDINQTTGSGGHLSMWENRCKHAAVCLLCAGQPRSAGDAAKLGQFVGKFSWVTGDLIGLKELIDIHICFVCYASKAKTTTLNNILYNILNTPLN